MAQLNKIADDKRTTTQQLAEQAIRQFLRDEVRRVLQRESDAFSAMHTELYDKYPGLYVAIQQGQVIDWDKDQLELFTRVDEQYPDTPVLIKQVLPEPEEIYTFRSPRIGNRE
ncbi:MAG: hypothetical protein JXA42_22015 [Anaerolineales bacterium]|nr:hypothetical protein [Anaerolineales bacterium]